MRAMYMGTDNTYRQHHLADKAEEQPGRGLIALCGSGTTQDGLVDLDAQHPARWAGESGNTVALGQWCTRCVQLANWR